MSMKRAPALAIVFFLLTPASLNLINGEFYTSNEIVEVLINDVTDHNELVVPRRYWVSEATYETSFNEEWSQVYATSNYDSFEDAVQCEDGGFAIAGTFNGTFAQSGYLWLIRIDSSGNHVWNHTYLTSSTSNRGMSLVRCQDEGFALAGNAGSNRILIRIADNGTELWRKIYTDDIGDSVKDLVQCEDEGFTILSYNGTFSYPPDMDYRLLRTDENGSILWEKSYSNQGWDEAFGLTLLNDGGFALIGVTQNVTSGDDEDIWVVRTDSNGLVIWNQTYGGSEQESGFAIAECENGNLIFTGMTTSFGQSTLWVVRITNTGQILWNQTYVGQGDAGYSICNTTDGGFAIGGFKSLNMDALAIRIDSAGRLLWTYDWGGGDFDICNSIVPCAEGDFLLVGKTTSFGGGDYDQFMLRASDFPFWNEVPADQAIHIEDLFYHDYNATLPHGLDTWWLENSPAFAINSLTGVVTNPSPLLEGDQSLIVGVSDLRSNWIKANLTITVYGDTPPVEVDEPIYISQESDFVSYGFLGEGKAENPYRIEDKIFWLNETYGSGRMISITNTRSHFIIENCSFQGKNELWEAGTPTEWMWFGGIGVELWNTSNGVIRNCSFYIASHAAFLVTSSQITFENCEMHNPLFESPEPQGIGVQIDDASTGNSVLNNKFTSIGTGVLIANSTYNDIENNTISECNVGISTYHFARANAFTNNTCVFNLYEGIGFSRSNDTLVIMNNCSYNGYSGIVIDKESMNNTLLYNTLEGNGGEREPESLHFLAQSEIEGFGVYVEWGSENNITWNDFVDNSKNAQNDFVGNSFDYNYYSDYNGEDSNGDLIGETVYEISGDSPTEDIHPRVVRLNEMNKPTTTPTSGGGLNEDSFLIVGVIVLGSLSLIMIVVLIVRKRT